MMKKYQIIYADPPWHFKNYNDKTATNWVGEHYPLMKLDDIKKLPIRNIAKKDCILFLWATSPCLTKALEVIEAWGFTYKTKAFCWVKLNKKNNGLFLGMGYWTRSNTEDCLLATIGHPRRIDASVHQIIERPRGKHSAKPSEVRDKIVKMCGNVSRIELFAREKTEGWDVWGNEIKSDVQL